MRNRILSYSRKIQDIIKEDNPETDWNDILSDLLIQIGFFQHERLIHIIVTVTFALLGIISIIATTFIENFMLILLDIAILCLLIPYIRHYYLLENEVQKMYTYYDIIVKKIK